MSKFEVQIEGNKDISNVMFVLFDGPKDSPYENVSLSEGIDTF